MQNIDYRPNVKTCDYCGFPMTAECDDMTLNYCTLCNLDNTKGKPYNPIDCVTDCLKGLVDATQRKGK